MANKEVGIYLLNKKKFENNSNDLIVQELVEKLTREIYKEVEIEEDCIDNYKIILLNKTSYSQDTWKDFWKCNITSSNIITSKQYANNFIALIYKDNNVFLIATNRAYHDITEYIVSFFGVSLVSYFFKDTDKIRSASYRNIMSNFLGGSEYLGEDYNATIDKYWDRINTNLMAELDKNRLYEELGLENNRKINKIRCDAKDNFTICSKIDLNQLICIIRKIDEITTNELIDKFNAIERVRDEQLIEKLNEEFITELYNKYIENKLDVCIVHKDMEKFFNSMGFGFQYNNTEICGTPNIPSNDDLKEMFTAINIDSKEDLKNKFKEIFLICYDDSQSAQLSDTIDAYLNMAIEFEGEEYVFQNKCWYKLTDNYIENLDKNFDFIKSSYEEKEVAFKPWNQEDEKNYIKKYRDKESYYMIHPRLEDGIEICDLLYVDNDNKELKLMYFKKGFGASTRDLSIQVAMGLKRFCSLVKEIDGRQKFYNKYIRDKNELSFEQFEEIVKKYGKNAIMVYKLTDGNTENSNIGKQSVVTAKNEIEMLGTSKFTLKCL